jgi:hypothetical protein
LLILLSLAVVVALGALAVRRSRAKALDTLRARWGQPIDRERRLDAMAATHRSRAAIVGLGQVLDDRTWDDLDLDAVYAVLDRTESTLGQHALYHRLRTVHDEQLPAFERLVRLIESDGSVRERTQLALGQLADPHGYDLWWLGGEDAIDLRRWHVIFPLLAAGTLLLAMLAIAFPVLVGPFLALVVTNVVVRYATDRGVWNAATAFRQVAPVITTAERLQFLDRDEFRPLLGPLRADSSQLRKLKTISRWISGNPLMLSPGVGPTAALVNDVIGVFYEYLNLGLLLDANGVYFGGRSLRAGRSALLRVLAGIGEVDCAISTASFRAGVRGWARPRFRPGPALVDLRDLRHPLLDDAVPNSITLTPGRGGLITGSNMSGKSTLLRTVGVNVVMAQALNTCLATAYDAPTLTVRSSIGRSDDLLTGKSYYIVEVESLLELITASTGRTSHLFLLDELFRGTNAVERIAAGEAVLRELVVTPGGSKPHVVLAATHDGELVDLLPELYEPRHFGDSVGPEGLLFDYRLRPGPATSRNAIALLRIHGAPPTLVDRALRSAAALDAVRGTAIEGR